MSSVTIFGDWRDDSQQNSAAKCKSDKKSAVNQWIFNTINSIYFQSLVKLEPMRERERERKKEREREREREVGREWENEKG